MNKAKQIASEFLSKDGKHRTTVDEDYRKPVTEEHIHPHRHEEIQAAVDREVHQEHHHTTVQPVKAQETLAERHTHNVAPVEHKTFEHGNDRDLRAAMEADAAKYRDTRTTHDTTTTSTTAPALEGERVHHHVHEHIQPVIMKKTHVPEKVHTTVPIHETHHMAPTHHGTTVLPAKPIDEFTGHGSRGTLEGRSAEVVYDQEGAPRGFGENMTHGGITGQHGSRGLTGENTGHSIGHSTGHTTGHTTGHSGITGQHSHSTTTGAAPTHRGHGDNIVSDETMRYSSGHGENMGTTGGLGSHTGAHRSSRPRGENMGSAGSSRSSSEDRNQPRSGALGTTHPTRATGHTGTTGHTTGTTGHTTGTTGHTTGHTTGNTTGHNLGSENTTHDTHHEKSTKSSGSLLDKLNPMKDSDGDGKKGFFS